MTEQTPLLAGKKGLVLGVANDRSIAWGAASRLAAEGAQLGFTYQNDAIARRVRPLADSVGATLVEPCDVSDAASMDALFAAVAKNWGGLDFVVHAVAYSDKAQLHGPYLQTTAENFTHTMNISCFSFTEIARRAEPLMAKNGHGGGALVTLSYLGAQRVIPNYNVMGVAKAALEASVKYLAADLGPAGIRVNAVSAGPMRTLAGSAIGSARRIYAATKANAPLRSAMTLDQVGNAVAYLASDLASGVTGEVHYVDGGYHVIGLPLNQPADANGENGGNPPPGG